MTIGAYLAELEHELRVRRAPRSRLLREADAHLRDLAGELVSAGVSTAEAESQAVARFGAARTVAARFAEAAASTSAHRAVTVAGAGFTAYSIVYVMFATASSPLLRDFPQGAPSFAAIQVAAVALVVAAVRSVRWRGEPAAPPAALTAIGSSLAVGVLALALGVLAETALALTRPAGVIVWTEGRWLTLGFVAVGGVLIVAALACARLARQASAVGAVPQEGPPLADDADVVMRRIRMPRQVRAVVLAALGHPVRSTLVIGAGAFAAVPTAGAISSGTPAVGSLALGGVEAAVVVLASLVVSDLRSRG